MPNDFSGLAFLRPYFPLPIPLQHPQIRFPIPPQDIVMVEDGLDLVDVVLELKAPGFLRGLVAGVAFDFDGGR